MKIIEVTLGSEDSEEEEVEHKMRQFMKMKEEICKDQEEDQEALDMKESTSTANKSQMRRESTEGFGQTEIDVFTFQEVKELIDKKVNETKASFQQQDEALQLRLE